MSEFSKRQNEIIQASIKLIANKGIQNFTTKSLASILGVSEPAIYRHFTNKKEIILSLLLLIKDKGKDLIAGEASLKQIEKMFISQTEQIIANPDLAAIVFSEEIFQNDKEISAMVSEMMNERYKMILLIIEKEQMNGNIRNDISAQQLTTIIMGTHRLIISKWRLNGHNSDLKSEVQEFWQSLLLILIR